MNILVTTLSLGINYTKDYCLRLIEDVLSLSNIDIYITTDCSYIIKEKYPNNKRIHIKEVKRENLKIRIPIGESKQSDDFNFNIRYLCLEHVCEIPNSVVIFTDCDNSFDWWDHEMVTQFINSHKMDGFDFFGPRTDWKFENVLNEINEIINQKKSSFKHEDFQRNMMWHKVFNYDLLNIDDVTNIDTCNHEWKNASLPAEYLLVFDNREYKLKKMVEMWKWFHDYLVNREYSFGTWAEGFEIGVSANYANFKDFNIGWNHELWNKIFHPNGYKNGHRGEIVHATER